MTTRRAPAAEPRAGPAAPAPVPLAGAAYLVHFDPLGGRFGRTVLGPDASVGDRWGDEGLWDALLDVLAACRGPLVAWLYAARLSGLGANRVAIRVDAAGPGFDREVFGERVRRLIESAVHPGGWTPFVGGGTRVPCWAPGTGNSVGLDLTPADRGEPLAFEPVDRLGIPEHTSDQSADSTVDLLMHIVNVKWGVLGPSRLPLTSPPEFLPLVRVLATGTPAERSAAAEALAELPLPCDEVAVLLWLTEGQTGAVQASVVRAVGNALRDGGQPDIDALRRSATADLLRRLDVFEGPAARAAGEVIGELVGREGRLRENWHGLVEGLAAAGLATYAIPTGDDINSLILAAPRSRAARKKLRDREGLGPELSGHTLIGRLRRMVHPDSRPAVAEAQELFGLMEGLRFGSLEANREAATLVRGVLVKLGRTLRCTTCGRGASLAVLPQKDSEAGVFKFYHGGRAGRTYHSGTAQLPPLRISDRAAPAE